MPDDDGQRVRITLRFLPGWPGTGISRLKMALKVLLRSFGLRNEGVEVLEAEKPNEPKERNPT